MAERHERIEDRSLAGFNEGGRKQAGSGAGMEVEEMGSDGDAEMLLAFVFEGSVGEMGRGKSAAGLLASGSQLCGTSGWFCHGA